MEANMKDLARTLLLILTALVTILTILFSTLAGTFGGMTDSNDIQNGNGNGDVERDQI